MRASLAGASLIVSLLSISLLAAEKPLDVSAIVPKTEAEKILGEPVRNPTPLNVNGKDGYYSKCNYYSTKSVRSLLLPDRHASVRRTSPTAAIHPRTRSTPTTQTIITRYHTTRPSPPPPSAHTHHHRTAHQ